MRGQFNLLDFKGDNFEHLHDPVFQRYIDATGCSFRTALDFSRKAIERLRSPSQFDAYVASYKRSQGNDIVLRLKLAMKNNHLLDLLLMVRTDDQSQISDYIIAFILQNVDTVEQISAIYDAIGIGFEKYGGLDSDLSLLRYRRGIYDFHSKYYFGETAESEKIAHACIAKMKQILHEKNYSVMSEKENAFYKNLFATKISQGPHNPEHSQWYERMVHGFYDEDVSCFIYN